MDANDDLTAAPARPPAAGPADGQAEHESSATVLSGGSTVPPLPTSISELGSLLEGRRLGDYQLDKFVGGGGMGAVFKALDTTLDRTVAVKVLAGQQSADEEMLRRFRNEAQSAARLNHANIGLVHAVGSSDGWHFIVFEYIEGTNLRDLVRQRGPLSIAATVDISLQIAAALDHAARRNVTHRDIKPSNIIITPGGQAKLVDMGLARLQQVAGEQDLTVSGMTLGTFDYISPEQARDARAADIRSDLYSLGCTMFFMLVGRAPFAEGTMVQKLLQHQQEPPPAVELLRTDVPRRLAAAVQRLMAKQPEDRYQQPVQLEADLVAIADEEGIDLTAGRPSLEAEPAAGRPARGPLWPWAIAALSLAGIVAALVTPAVDSEPPPVPPARLRPVVDPATVKRVVSLPTGANEFGDFTAAVAAAADGDVIELAADQEHLIGPLDLAGRRLTVRAAAGGRPLLRVDQSKFPDASEDQVAWRIAAGRLALTGIDLRMDGRGDSASGRRALFQVGPGGGLVCRDVGLAVATPSASEEAAGGSLGRDCLLVVADIPGEIAEERTASSGPPAFGSRGLATLEMPATVEMIDVVFNGGGTWCGIEEGVVLNLRWVGGGVTTTGRFLEAGSGTAMPQDGALVRLELEDATFACQEGFLRLADSPTQSRVPRLVAKVDQCRFLVPEPAALIEQVGVAEPEAYQTAVDWRDRLGRYEGSSIFRRIDGAGDTVEIDFAAAPRPLAHQPFFDGWPANPSRPD